MLTRTCECGAGCHLAEDRAAGRATGLSFESLMLAETLHRTANDLTCVIGSLREIRRQLDQPRLPGIDAVIRRAFEVSELQGLLVPPMQSSAVDLSERLEEVCRLIARTRLDGGTVGLTVHADHCELDATTCWTVTTIVVELVVNAARHAFTGGVGEIVVRAWNADGCLFVIVMDDGVGWRSGGTSPTPGIGLGTGIIERLAVASGGCLRRIPVPVGTLFEYSLRLDRGA